MNEASLLGEVEITLILDPTIIKEHFKYDGALKKLRIFVHKHRDGCTLELVGAIALHDF